MNQTKTAKQIFDEINQDYGVENMDYDFFKKHIFDVGQVAEFIKYLDTPTPDWQQDC